MAAAALALLGAPAFAQTTPVPPQDPPKQKVDPSAPQPTPAPSPPKTEPPVPPVQDPVEEAPPAEEVLPAEPAPNAPAAPAPRTRPRPATTPADTAARPAAAPETPAPNTTVAVQVAQVVARPPALRVYFAPRASDSQRPVAPAASRLRLTVDRQAVDIDRVVPVSQEGTAYVLLVDVSRTLRAEDFTASQEALARWIDRMNPRDRVAIYAFGQQVRLVQDYTADRARARTALDNLTPRDTETSLYKGLADAFAKAQAADSTLPARRVVILASDGLDDFPSGVQQPEVLRRMQQQPVPLYVVGLRSSGDTAGLDRLAALARASGGAFFRATDRAVSAVFDELRSVVTGMFVAEASCATCAADGRSHRVQLTYTTADGTALSDGLDVPFQANARPDTVAAETEPPSTSDRPLWPWLLGAGLLALGGLGWAASRRRRAVAVAPAPVGPVHPVQEAVPGVVPAAGAAYAAAAHEPAATIAVPRRGRSADDVAASIAREEDRHAAPRRARTRVELRPAQGGAPLLADVETSALVGRSAQRAHLVVPGDPAISGRHARLVRQEDGSLWVEDLGSTNGTFVNGARLDAPRALTSGDTLRLGATDLVVTLGRERVA